MEGVMGRVVKSIRIDEKTLSEGREKEVKKL